VAAAFYRAAHQVLEGGRIFADPLAVAILGADAATLGSDREQQPARRRMRIFVALRTRFAEDALAAAVARGTRQLVVLGAGLDTYAYRGAERERLRIFEVDHPSTQAWKRQRLAEAGIPVPPRLTFAPVDFERETLGGGLAAAGFEPAVPTFFLWLGVVPYLTKEAVGATLAFIAALPGGAEVVFDYSDPPESLTHDLRAQHEERAARVAALGESFLSHFEPEQLHDRLRELGFAEIEDLGLPAIAARYFPRRPAAAPHRGGHVLRARLERRA
jgi:methyltransferase (TIGR00027 family)